MENYPTTNKTDIGAYVNGSRNICAAVSNEKNKPDFRMVGGSGILSLYRTKDICTHVLLCTATEESLEGHDPR